MAANSRSETLKLDTPDAFPAFPYQPYEIQLELMRVSMICRCPQHSPFDLDDAIRSMFTRRLKRERQL